MAQNTLTRQERGKLAEQLVRGLHRDPAKEVEETVTDHAQHHYADLIGNRPLSCCISEINEYHWFDLLTVQIPDDISWRPDVIMLAVWKQKYRWSELPSQEFGEDNLPPFTLEFSRGLNVNRHRREQLLTCEFRVYYPVEVKSGAKKTLTEHQSTAIPRVAENVDFVHPVIASVDIENLPDQYLMEAELFRYSPWAASDSRNRS